MNFELDGLKSVCNYISNIFSSKFFCRVDVDTQPHAMRIDICIEKTILGDSIHFLLKHHIKQLKLTSFFNLISVYFCHFEENFKTQFHFDVVAQYNLTSDLY